MNICIAIVYGLQVRCWIRLFGENLTHLVKRTVSPYIFKAKPCAHMNPVSSLVNCDSIHSWKKMLPPVRIELTAPGLRDQCSTTELKRRNCLSDKFEISSNMHNLIFTNFPGFPWSWDKSIKFSQSKGRFSLKTFCHRDNKCALLSAPSEVAWLKIVAF